MTRKLKWERARQYKGALATNDEQDALEKDVAARWLTNWAPNKKTIAAMKEARRGKLKSYKTSAEVMAALNEDD